MSTMTLEQAIASAEVRNEMRGDSGRYPNGEGWGHCFRVDGFWLPKDAWQTIRQHLRDQEAEIAELRKIKEERWAVVATRNAAVMRAEKAEALLRECQELFRPKPYSLGFGSYEVISLMGRITAHLGGEQ